MRRTSNASRRCGGAALIVIAAGMLALSACGPGSSRGTGSSAAKGQAGTWFLVSVSRPAHGTITSADGQLNCGTAGGAANACGPARYAWTATATLNAIPDAGYAFGTWAGDCALTGPCVFTSGGDKFVAAFFGPPGRVPHGNFSSPAIHGPAYFDSLAGLPGSRNCADAGCHGAALSGAGIAPSCQTCHASAGWTSWQTNCSFCHGARNATTKAGYDGAAHPAWSAPPDALSQRLDGRPAPARTGAHQAHLLGVDVAGQGFAGPFACATCHAVPADLKHVRGASARAVVALTGAGQGQLPASLGSYDGASGTCTTYCHGASPSPAWSTSGIACGDCHGLPPSSPHPAVSSATTACAGCHSGTVNADGTLNLAGGKHVNGTVDVAGGTGGSGCAACHGFPPSTGAHVAHLGLTAAQSASGYGDTRILQDRYPDATPATAPAVYGYGCGLCHPVDATKHMDGQVEVTLYEAAAPAQSLKARNAATAAYDKARGTCSGVYCHSSGQQGAAYVTTPGWTSGTHLGCAGCHDNPPRYASGGAASATANSHVQLADDGYEFGHFGGLIGPWLANYHGGSANAARDAAPITCQTCHFDTTDPANTGPSGFYYLDTAGDYQLPGGDPGRLTSLWYQRLQCTSCHSSGSAGAPIGTGKVLPLRHVNGTRDVSFDPRTALPAISWLPAAPNLPTQPYWMTGATLMPDWPSYVVFNGSTASFSLSMSRYDPAAKTCTSVACHMAENPTWGKPYLYLGNPNQCSACHRM